MTKKKLNEELKNYWLEYITETDKEFQINKHFIDEDGYNVIDMLGDLPLELLENEDFILNCLDVNSEYFALAGDKLKSNERFIIKALKRNKYILFTHFKEEYLKYPNYSEIIRDAIKSSGYFMRFATNELRKDKTLVLEGLQTDEYTLKYADADLFQDYNFLISAAQINGMILHWLIGFYGNNNFWHDKTLTLTAVKNVGFALKYAAPEFKNDKEVVIAAITQSIDSIVYASEEIIRDPYILNIIRTNNPEYIKILKLEKL